MKTISFALAAALLATASAAQAGVSEDFAACNGRMKPKSKDDGLRGVASEKVGFAEPFMGAPSTRSGASCTKGLESATGNVAKARACGVRARRIFVPVETTRRQCRDTICHGRHWRLLTPACPQDRAGGGAHRGCGGAGGRGAPRRLGPLYYEDQPKNAAKTARR